MQMYVLTVLEVRCSEWVLLGPNREACRAAFLLKTFAASRSACVLWLMAPSSPSKPAAECLEVSDATPCLGHHPSPLARLPPHL